MSGASGRPEPGAHQVAAIIPALNEVAAIGELTVALLARGSCCVLVVDGGSTDGTQRAAAAAGATVIHEPRRGYGRACLTGAEHAMAEHPIVAFLDGDGSCDPADLAPLVAALDEGNGFDLVLGARRSAAVEPGALPWHARLGNRLVAWILSHRTGRRVIDLPPYKVIRRAALATIDLDDAGFGWTVQMVARALRAPTLRVTERPVRFRLRRGGESKVSGNLRASFSAGRRMLERAVSETVARPVIALMAKAPRPGHAKTRLAAGIGQPAALELWAACLGDLGPTIRAAARGRADTIAMVPAAEDVGPVAELLGPGWEVMVQKRAALGGAITDAFVAARARGADRAIAVSGDNPSLPAEWLLAGLDELRRSPSVLGPCPDGGYYLVGIQLGGALDALAARVERVFHAASLGGESALRTTARALEAEGLRPRCLSTWPDIDTVRDLRQLADSLAGPEPAAPRTRAWLTAHAALVPGVGHVPVPTPNERSMAAPQMTSRSIVMAGTGEPQA